MASRVGVSHRRVHCLAPASMYYQSSTSNTNKSTGIKAKRPRPRGVGHTSYPEEVLPVDRRGARTQVGEQAVDLAEVTAPDEGFRRPAGRQRRGMVCRQDTMWWTVDDGA